jgi:hypothetical protein
MPFWLAGQLVTLNEIDLYVLFKDYMNGDFNLRVKRFICLERVNEYGIANYFYQRSTYFRKREARTCMMFSGILIDIRILFDKEKRGQATLFSGILIGI